MFLKWDLIEFREGVRRLASEVKGGKGGAPGLRFTAPNSKVKLVKAPGPGRWQSCPRACNQEWGPLWLGGSGVRRVVQIHHGGRFDSQSGHMQESTHECINKWNDKSMFLSPFLSLSKNQSIKMFFKKWGSFWCWLAGSVSEVSAGTRFWDS